MEYADVLFGAYDAAGRLHDFLEPGIQVCIVVPAAELGFHRLAHLLVDIVDLRQAERGHEGADQAIAYEIDAFRKRTTQYGEPHAAFAASEPGDERIALRLAHSRRL